MIATRTAIIYAPCGFIKPTGKEKVFPYELKGGGLTTPNERRIGSVLKGPVDRLV